jgi:hypothetical protein
MTYQYLTLVHGHRTINGHSSYDPPLLALLSGRDQGFGDASHLGAAVACVRALGARYVVVHGGRFGSPATETALLHEFESGQIAARHDFGRTVVFALAEDVPRWTAFPIRFRTPRCARDRRIRRTGFRCCSTAIETAGG